MTRIRHVLLAALGFFLMLSATNASAQDCTNFDRTEYDLNIAQAEQLLTELEKMADGVLEKKVLTDAEGARYDEITNAYASSMMTAYQNVYLAAERAGESEGRDGDARLMAEFELVASKHEGRTIALALKWEKIHAGIAQREIIQKEARLAPEPDAADPIQQLTQEGQQQLTLRPGDGVLRPEFLALAAKGERKDSSLGGMCRSAASSVGELLVPTADAAQIAKCIPPCIAKNWSACVGCIWNAGPVVVNAWNNFVSCWNSAGACKWYTPWNCLKKAWCLAQFIAVLA